VLMIDRAAKAVHEVLSRANVVAYLEMPEDTANVVASAVIAAMREPTDEMLSAGEAPGENWWDDEGPETVWRRMIEAAEQRAGLTRSGEE
jgi:hypothetical protein